MEVSFRDGEGVAPPHPPRPGLEPRSNSCRQNVNHVGNLTQKREKSIRYLEQELDLPRGNMDKSLLGDDEAVIDRDASLHESDFGAEEQKRLTKERSYLRKIMEAMSTMKSFEREGAEVLRGIEIRLMDVSYTVPVDKNKGGIRTVFGSELKSLKVQQYAREIKVRRHRTKSPGGTTEFTMRRRIHALRNVNLVIRPGKFYLVLGPPGYGMTTLLRAIASLLHTSKKGPNLEGSITYNGLKISDRRGVVLRNAISFVDQMDRHAPRLTVEETFDFAFQCKGGTHRSPLLQVGMEGTDAANLELDREKARVNLTMEALGLSHVRDTFVGSTEVRGVSGGQRRRVTLGEMMMFQAPILCGDEISTGLDAASTYDICDILARTTKFVRTTRVVSLLQPSPETFSLFDEVIVLADGMIIYAGPVLDAMKHFHSIGFGPPDHMDDADFLQSLGTPDGREYYFGGGLCPDPEKLAALFTESIHGHCIIGKLNVPPKVNWNIIHKGAAVEDEETPESSMSPDELYGNQYHVGFWKATWLNAVRHFTLWKRDIRFVRANFIKNVVMGISVGLVFFQTKNIESILGVMFQSMLFIMLGAMTAAPSQMDDRVVFYRHKDHNFFPTLSFVLGRAIAFIPQAVMDITTFGTLIYFLVGLELDVAKFFTFYAILLVFTIVMSTMLSVATSIALNKSAVQAMSAIIILLNMFFCGFFVAPEVIPVYYYWIYWWCPLAWAYRGVIVNQFLSESYSSPAEGRPSATQGETILENAGFTLDGEAFTQEWIAYSFVYLCPYIVLMILMAGLCLAFVRFEVGKSGGGSANERQEEIAPLDNEEETLFDLPFIPIDLTFIDVCFEVKKSTESNTIKLLNKVNGHLQPGRMCALMGSSGAGKTTLMEVIALRKQSGKIDGEVRLNGHLQESASFRRCSGYVDQFDVQTPELTVRETILFSARLRLDSSDPQMKSDENKVKFVDQIIKTMELGSQHNMLVGDDESGGLSFEQRKRLSIAVELAASPSVIFLDEPTSGLDSRAAMLVVKFLKRIASTGRTVCATIHQPSSIVFEMFDDLLLMTTGGRTVFCGEKGKNSSHLIDYFQGLGGTKINRGENAATWMLNLITTSRDEGTPDYADLFERSEQHAKIINDIDQITEGATEGTKITYESVHATSRNMRHWLVRKRLMLIYWRSPSYNRSRLLLSILVAFLLASVFLHNRRPEVMSEQEISSVFSTIFLSFIITGIMAITTVLPVMLKIRNVFYRHRAAGMMDHTSMALALGFAEEGFVLLSSALFCVVFYFTIGLETNFRKFVAFWGFFTFNLGISSYFGQAFMCLVPTLGTASILCSVLIGMNNFFSGLIVRPQYLNGFWQAPYWITPGRYVYEGLMASQFSQDTRTVCANTDSMFYNDLNCTIVQTDIQCSCNGTVTEFFYVYFGNRFQHDNLFFKCSCPGIHLVACKIIDILGFKAI